MTRHCSFSRLALPFTFQSMVAETSDSRKPLRALKLNDIFPLLELFLNFFWCFVERSNCVLFKKNVPHTNYILYLSHSMYRTKTKSFIKRRFYCHLKSFWLEMSSQDSWRPLVNQLKAPFFLTPGGHKGVPESKFKCGFEPALEDKKV